MDFVNDSFDKLNIEIDSDKNYETGTSIFAQKAMLLHTIKYLIYVNDEIKNQEK